MSSDKRTLCHLHHTTSRNIWCSCPSIGSVNERNSEGNQGRRWWRADSSDLQLNDGLGSLEHFPEKWTPVFRKEMRPSIESRARSCPRPRRILLNLFGTRSSAACGFPSGTEGASIEAGSTEGRVIDDRGECCL